MKHSKSFKFSKNPRVRSWTNILMSAPRFVAPLGALAAATMLAACVPEMRYEEAVSAAEVEAEARRRAEVELAATKARASALEAELAARDQKLESRDQRLAEAGLKHGMLAKEHDESSLVLDQLQSDLRRANESLKSYAATNQRLERELAKNRGEAAPAATETAAAMPAASVAAAPASAAPSTASAAEIAALMPMIESAVAAAGLSDRVKVARRGDGIVLTISERALFASGSATPNADLLRALDLASRSLESRPGLVAKLRESGKAAAVPESLGVERRERLVRALEERKLGQRVAYQPASDSAAAESYELWLGEPGAIVPAPTKALTPTPVSSAPKLQPPG